MAPWLTHRHTHTETVFDWLYYKLKHWAKNQSLQYKLAGYRELMNSKCLTEKWDSVGELATGVIYADIINSMLWMHGHVSVGFFRILFLQGKHNGNA